MSSPGLRGTSLRHDRTVTSRFVVRTRAAVAADELFDVSLDIDAHVASMEQSGERAISGVVSGRIDLGQEVTWRARHFGIWFTMTSRITALDRPTRFVDEQVRGPFRWFRHEHRFDDVTGVTTMTDTIDLASPIFGILAERAVLVPYLRRLIRVRNAHLLDRLGLGPTTDPGAAAWEPGESSPYRAVESATHLGRGEAVWEFASREVLRWGVKTRSGFRISDAHEVIPGERLQITAAIGPLSIREPVEVRSVIREPDRVGFSYVALPGHPVRGEEAFIVHREGEDVFLSIRSLAAPASRGVWRFAYPVLRVAQMIVRRRYQSALR